MSLEFTQYLGFEISNKCNLALAHPKCPSSHPERYGKLNTSRPLTDDIIQSTIHSAYRDHKFTGAITWHYYNEPLLSWKRLKPLMESIRKDIPEASFHLWTNGECFPKDLSGLEMFSKIWLTNYKHQSFPELLAYMPPGSVNIKTMDVMDDRLIPLQCEDLGCCHRPFYELVIDYFGNGHICCSDYKGTSNIGNVWDNDLQHILTEYVKIRGVLARAPLQSNALDICKWCTLKVNGISNMVPSVYEHTVAALRQGKI
jgi:MoaA/NifB/PqqE/SkfB family radical SAM enzyme